MSTIAEWSREGEPKLPLLASIVDSSDDAIISKTLDGIITSWNKSAEEMYGYTAKEIMGRSIALLMPEGSTEMTDILEKIRRGQRVDHFHTTRVRRDGTTVPISLTVSPICDRTGVLIGASSIARATSRARATQAEVAHLASIVDSSDDAIISKTLDGVITSWNKSAEDMYGYTAKEIVGRSIALLMPEGSTEMTDILEKIRRGQRVDHFHTTRVRRDGTTLPISLTVSPIYDGTGAIIGASSIARDITTQVRANREITRLNEWYARSQEISKTGCWEYDGRSRRLMWTDEVYRIYGLDPASVQPTLEQAIAAFDPDSALAIDAAFSRLVAVGEPYDLELGLVRADGTQIWVRTNGAAVIEHGQIIRVGGAIADITERKCAQDKLREANAELSRRYAQPADTNEAL